jgi:hypothetical protein
MLSRDIPSAIKRRLRQESGFGCCVCGHPFIEYHHIVPFTEIESHDSREMMVLCPNHHQECTVGALDRNSQYIAKGNPFNIARGFANGQFVNAAKVIAAYLGGNIMFGTGCKLMVGDEPLLAIRSDEKGRLLLTVMLYSSSDELLLSIRDNEWMTGDPFPWDFEFGINTLCLRNASRNINLNIDARSLPIRIRGDLWRKRAGFSIESDVLRINGIVANMQFMNLGLVAMTLVANIGTRSVSIVPDSKLKGMVISEPDPAVMLQRGIEGFQLLCKQAHLGRNDHCPCGSGLKVKVCHPEYC